MTYAKPELVELVYAAQAIQTTGGDSTGDKQAQALENGEGDHTGHSSTGSAYQADE